MLIQCRNCVFLIHSANLSLVIRILEILKSTLTLETRTKKKNYIFQDSRLILEKSILMLVKVKIN